MGIPIRIIQVKWLTSVSFTSQETLIVKSNWADAKFDGLVNFQMSGPPGQRQFELSAKPSDCYVPVSPFLWVVGMLYTELFEAL